jgi:hypothetical protein
MELDAMTALYDEYLVVDQNNESIGLGWGPTRDLAQAQQALAWTAEQRDYLAREAAAEDADPIARARSNEWRYASAKFNKRQFRIVQRQISAWRELEPQP